VSDERPNILLIMSDQHHAGVMGCAGDPAAHTPNLDSLAAAGASFDAAYCPFPLCGPSRMAFLTARHPFEIDCWTNETQLDSDAATFAHAFLAAGYETVLSGRMHFVGHDQRHGFVERLVGDVPESAHLAAGWKLRTVLGDLVDCPGCSRIGVLKSGPGQTGYHAYDKAVCRATVDWLARRGRTPKAPPFLLVVGFASPHCPYVAPPEDFARAAGRISPADLPAGDEALHPLLRQWRRATGLEPPPPVDAQWRARVAYCGLCGLLDRLVGRVLAALAEAGLAERTVVVYTSDHGEMLGEHGLWWKSTFYDGAARVPLLVAAPGRIAPGRRIAQPVSLIDVGPTLLDLAAAGPLPGASGRSLRGLLEGSDAAGEQPVFAENIARAAGGEIVPERMVRLGRWKYNHADGYPPELFDLADDPGERRSRAADPACAEVLERLRAEALRDWDPAFVRRRLDAHLRARPLIAEWVRRARPAEPDPPWFDTPPVNRFEAVRPPDGP